MRISHRGRKGHGELNRDYTFETTFTIAKPLVCEKLGGMSFLKTLRGDIRSNFVGILMGGIIGIVGPVCALIWKSYHKEDIPWMIFTLVVCLGIVLVVVAILSFRRTNRSPSEAVEDSDRSGAAQVIYAHRPHRTFKQLVEDSTIVLPSRAVRQGFRIDALPPVPDTRNMTQHMWHEGAKVMFTGDAVVSVENLIPDQGLGLVNFRLMSIAPPLKAKKVWKPSTQDSILKRIEFPDIPKNSSLNPGITTEVRLFKATRPFSADSPLQIEVEFYGDWPEGYNTTFTPSEKHVMILEVTGNGVGRAEAKFDLIFSTNPAKSVFTLSLVKPGVPGITADRHFMKDEELHALLSSIKGRASLKAVSLLKPYLGLWTHIEGEVKHTSALLDDSLAVVYKQPEGDAIGCMFRKEWREKLTNFDEGDPIQIVGQIGQNQGGEQLFLVDCEILN